MGRQIEELAWQRTPMGEISLRRRLEPTLNVDVYEVRLGDDFLMSSLFTVAEVELARLGLAELTGRGLDVVVGGLGLGCTARAVLEDPRVQSLHVVEALGEVIAWHERGLLPLSVELTTDARCRLVHADFFALMHAGPGRAASLPDRCHAILVDIDHSPRQVLAPSHAAFYTREGLHRLAGRLHPSGVFALWSDDPPDSDFLAVLDDVFTKAVAHVVDFPNFYTGGRSTNTVYVATVGPQATAPSPTT